MNVVGQCDSTNRCDECEGNCIHDGDCKSGLKCMHRVGFEAVHGCSGAGGERDVYGKGICYNTSIPINTVRWGNKCKVTDKCDICFGNCTVDDDCIGSLRCAHRDKGIEVPGCQFPSDKPWLFTDNSHNYCKLICIDITFRFIFCSSLQDSIFFEQVSNHILSQQMLVK